MPDRRTFRQVILRRVPRGTPTEDDFAIEGAPIPAPEDGQFVVRNAYVSLDPAIRQRLTGINSYAAHVAVGQPLTSTTLGQVVASREPRARVGDHVVGFHSVGEYSLSHWNPLTRRIDIDATESPTHHLSVLGITGLTAYFGLLDVGAPRAGETILVSSAAGAVGSIAAQIARIRGCRVIGLAGGSDKCRRLTETFRLDAAIDYHGHDLDGLTAAIRAAAPRGVDVFFDNVGGLQLDAALDCMNLEGRIALCGLISHYNSGEAPGFANLFQVIARCLRVQGFTVLRYADRFPEALSDLKGWVDGRQLTFEEHVEAGIEAAVPAFLKLFDGSHRGKLILDVQDPSARG